MSDFDGVPPERKVVAVIGAGAFGTAMATVATRNNHEVRLWARRPEMVDHINTKRRNPDYVSEFDLLDNLTAVKTIEAALDGADVMILCLPVQSVPTWVAENKHFALRIEAFKLRHEATHAVALLRWWAEHTQVRA